MHRFEAIDAAFPDLHAEMIDGEVCIETLVGWAHGRMVVTLLTQLAAQWCVATKVNTVHDSWQGMTYLRPDLSVADLSHQGVNHEDFPADELALVGEVVSPSTADKDTRRKVEKYAIAGIPYYLVVNPINRECVLHSLPEDGRDRSRVVSKFGDPVPIGAPIDTDLDTSALRTY
ncbi:Uma2 family endonuclease [Streptomyces mashuensis]|nr:Uma2 family endonuclease [Streptomyces mashuensis]